MINKHKLRISIVVLLTLEMMNGIQLFCFAVDSKMLNIINENSSYEIRIFTLIIMLLIIMVVKVIRICL